MKKCEIDTSTSNNWKLINPQTPSSMCLLLLLLLLGDMRLFDDKMLLITHHGIANYHRFMKNCLLEAIKINISLISCKLIFQLSSRIFHFTNLPCQCQWDGKTLHYCVCQRKFLSRLRIQQHCRARPYLLEAIYLKLKLTAVQLFLLFTAAMNTST